MRIATTMGLAVEQDCEATRETPRDEAPAGAEAAGRTPLRAVPTRALPPVPLPSPAAHPLWRAWVRNSPSRNSCLNLSAV